MGRKNYGDMKKLFEMVDILIQLHLKNLLKRKDITETTGKILIATLYYIILLRRNLISSAH